VAERNGAEGKETAAVVVEKIPVGISSCLLGENVRFNGGHQLDSYVDRTLGQYFEYRPFCPEVDIGLGVPRKPIRLIRSEEEIACVDIEDASLDYTQALSDSADRQNSWVADVCGYILKKASPSCGMERVKVYGRHQTTRDGVGIFAARLMRNFPGLPVEEEGRLGDPVLRENFIQRVYVMYRWKKMCSTGMTVAALVDFHARHKLILMSHCQQSYRELGPLVAATNRDNLASAAEAYFQGLMQALKKRANRGNHVNVLQHVQGYLKTALDADDRAELSETIERYHRGLLPLIVPITLLNHHFRRNPNEYIARSYYMQPYPAEMSLQNRI
jgi:uncharacterized protein YbgA (DUF1722 family)/uncharacterized protein YbbK (DUF523 family)